MVDFDQRMASVARSVFGQDVGLDVPRMEEPRWDSLCHLKLIIAFEGEFNVRVPIERIDGIRTLREYGEFL